MAFSSDSRFLARPKPGGTEVYDIRAGRTLRTLRSSDATGAVAFSPDGQLLATGRGNEIIIWDIASGKQVLPPLTGHHSYVSKIAFSPDGKTVLAGGDECVLRLWNLATGQEVGKVPQAYSFTLSSDGNTLAIYMSGWMRLIYVPPLAEFDKVEGSQAEVR